MGSATRYSRIRNSLGKMRFCVFAYIKYGGIFCILRTCAGMEFLLKPSLFSTLGRLRNYIVPTIMTKHEEKIIKTVCRLPAQNTSTTKLESLLQLHGVFPKSSQMRESQRGHMTIIIKKTSFLKASATKNCRC